MPATVTGIIRNEDSLLWTQYAPDQSPSFVFGSGVPALSKHSVTAAAINTTELRYRFVILPFTRLDRVLAVLPQEAADSLMQSPRAPVFAISMQPAENQSRVFYAVAEQELIRQELMAYSAAGINPVNLVPAELSSWPLLEVQGLVDHMDNFIVIDCSVEQAAVYRVSDGYLAEVRKLSPAAVAAGEKVAEQELRWIVDSMNVQNTKLFCLGETPQFWDRLLNSQLRETAEIPGLQSLCPGAGDWQWLRPAGLAISGGQSLWRDRMLNFRQGEFAFQGQLKTWVYPWRYAAFFALLAAGLFFVQQYRQYAALDRQYAELKQQIEVEFNRALPNVPLVDPVMQMQQALARAGTVAGDNRQLRQWIGLVQKHVPVSAKVQWQQMVYEKGRLNLQGEVASYDDMNRIQQALEKVKSIKSVEVREAQIIQKNRKVRFRLELS